MSGACSAERSGRVAAPLDASVEGDAAELSDAANHSDTGSTVPDGGHVRRVQLGVDLTVEGGGIHGQAAEGLRTFRGIPYAAPPLGPLRFKPPQRHPGFSKTLDATEHKPACPQDGSNLLDPVSDSSEDCLTLNIFAHDTRREDEPLKPVMVWFHGGGYVSGHGGSKLYDGSRIARIGDVVVVTVNYRLGALGFLAIDALREESKDGSVGNYGFLDQRAALAWVQRNIEIFDGDPNNVTAFGESAGAQSLCAHLASPESHPLFHRAILQSAGSCKDLIAYEQDAVIAGGARARGNEFVAATSCAGSSNALQCLRALPVQEVVKAQSAIAQNLFGSPVLGLTIDGVTIAEQPYSTLSRSGALSTPIIIGAMKEEARLFLRAGKLLNKSPNGVGAIYSIGDYHEIALKLARQNADRASKLEAIYPLNAYPSPGDAMAAMVTDVWYKCAAMHVAALFEAHGSAAFVYEFGGTLGGLGAIVGASHSVDVPFTFGTNVTLALRPVSQATSIELDDADRALSDRVIALWSSFARSAVPSAAPPWSTASRGVYLLDEESGRMQAPIAEGRCEKLETLGFFSDA